MKDGFTKTVRLWEFERLKSCLPKPPAQVLEMGAGAGWQSQLLASAGYSVLAADVPGNVFETLVFPIQRYDGKEFPFADGLFDFTFISNVLDHVEDQRRFCREVQRVNKPGGRWIVVAPTTAWRLWTLIFFYIALPARMLSARRKRAAANSSASPSPAKRPLLKKLLPPLGTNGNALTELILFSQRHRTAFFAENGWKVAASYPSGLFYTGVPMLGLKLPMPARQKLSRLLGSACRIYVLEPADAGR
jgi:SAM-dependent methyltransferase